MILDDPFDAVANLAELTRTTFKTPAAGNASRPFKVLSASQEEGLEVRTSRGGRVTLRPEAFGAAIKLLSDLAVDDPGGWVKVSDPTLVQILQAENRDKACNSYVLPLLEAVGQIELDRGRPARARLPQAASEGDEGTA